MHTTVQDFQKKFTKKKVPVLRPGMIVKVTHKFKEGEKERSQLFQGVIIKMHAKKSLNATFTVRKIVDGIGVEKIFPLHSPMIEVEVVRASKVRRAKLYYLRDRAGKSARLKEMHKDYGEMELDEPMMKLVEEEQKVEAAAPAVEAATTEEKVETPAEEAKTEAPAEEKKEEATEAPAEEKKEEAPAEEAKAEEKKEEAKE